MKRLPPLILCFLLLLPIVPKVVAAPAGTVTASVCRPGLDLNDPPQTMTAVRLRLNGQAIAGEMPAVILESRTLAPLRLLAEGLGAQVEWLPDDGQVCVTRGEDAIVLTIGSATALVNGQPQDLPDGVPATVLSCEGQGYTMVPLRFFSETFGCRVGWDQGSYTASIFEPSYIEPLIGDLDAPAAPAGCLIVLDAGHGGYTPGAYYEETPEKDLNFSMIQKLDTILQGLGYNTLLTRDSDVFVDLYDRAGIANRAHADLFVSIHCNAAKNAPTFQGLYVYHHPDDEEGRVLAQAIQTPACAFTGAVDRGVESADFVVVRETEMPAVLVEAGFMTCHEELVRLRSEAYQTRVAQGIAQGIVRYLNGKN